PRPSACKSAKAAMGQPVGGEGRFNGSSLVCVGSAYARSLAMSRRGATKLLITSSSSTRLRKLDAMQTVDPPRFATKIQYAKSVSAKIQRLPGRNAKAPDELLSFQ